MVAVSLKKKKERRHEQGRTALLACDNENEMYEVLSGTAIPPKQSAVMSILHKDNTPVLSDFLQRDLLLLNLAGTTKEEIIDELLDAVTAKGCVKDKDAVRKEILAREAQMSTGMEKGVAIPHARTDSVDDLVCVIGIKRNGIDFDALDGGLSQIFVLTLTPKESNAAHMQFMAMISRMLDESGRKAVLEAKTCDELWDVMTQQG